MNKGFTKIKIFVHKIEKNVVNSVVKALNSEFGLGVVQIEELKLPEKALNKQRKQYDANVLIDLLNKIKGENTALWIIPYDIYCPGFNFIFGLANPYSCAILSTARLNTTDLICKETIHEVGHVFGLEHCKEPCVMAYSNSLYEAMRKGNKLCDSCKRKLTSLKKSIS